MQTLPEILDIWDRETSKQIPFDQWLLSIRDSNFSGHEK